jgi:serine/threonine protein kinase
MSADLKLAETKSILPTFTDSSLIMSTGASLTYASPEVLAGAKATMASDVYSFGAHLLHSPLMCVPSGVCMIEMLFVCEAYEDLRMSVDQFRLGVVAGKVRPKIPGTDASHNA